MEGWWFAVKKSVLQKLRNGNATKISPHLPTQCFKLEFSAD
jgi:hypothetical protein